MYHYEYIQVNFDYGDLDQLNSLGMSGWRLCSVEKIGVGAGNEHPYIAIMEKEVVVIPLTDPRNPYFYSNIKQYGKSPLEDMEKDAEKNRNK